MVQVVLIIVLTINISIWLRFDNSSKALPDRQQVGLSVVRYIFSNIIDRQFLFESCKSFV